jgi:hypothetical protein
MQRSLQELLTALDHHMGRLINGLALFSNVFVVQKKTPLHVKATYQDQHVLCKRGALWSLWASGLHHLHCNSAIQNMVKVL